MRLHASLAIAILIAALAPAACSRTDREWISDERYLQAKEIYLKNEDMAATRQILRDERYWKKAEVNEAEYRLRKQLRLDKPQAGRPSAGAPADAPASSATDLPPLPAAR